MGNSNCQEKTGRNYRLQPPHTHKKSFNPGTLGGDRLLATGSVINILS